MDRTKAMQQKAVDFFNSGYNCSQAVLLTYADPLGLDPEEAVKLAGGFGGGMGGCGHTCGALTGAFMALGLKYSKADPKDKQNKESVYQAVKQAMELFKHRTGHTNCRDLLGFDLGTPEGRKAAAKPGAFDACEGFVAEAVAAIEAIFSQ